MRKRIRRYPLPGESAFIDFDPAAAAFADAFGGSGGMGEAERGCGFRDEGGIYACVPTSPNGRPLEHFVLCQPLRIDADEYGITPLGAKIIELPEACLHCSGAGKVKTLHFAPPSAFPIAEEDEKPPFGAVNMEEAQIDCPECKGLGVVPVSHVFDIIGGTHYPNVADFLEEARRLGISRRLEFSAGTETPCDACNGSGEESRPESEISTRPSVRACSKCGGAGTLPGANQYAKLTARSRLFLLHSRAIIENPGDYWEKITKGEAAALVEAGGCPKALPEHRLSPDLGLDETLRLFNQPAPGCSALYWHDLDPETCGDARPDGCMLCGDTLGGYAPENCPDCSNPQNLADMPRFSRREMPAFAYGGFARPEGIKPLHNLGVFGIFPLARLEVVDPSGGDEYSAAIERASAAKLPVKITDC